MILAWEKSKRALSIVSPKTLLSIKIKLLQIAIHTAVYSIVSILLRSLGVF